MTNIRHIYFLGIGGIGMSALARYFSCSGKKVAGYDRTPTALTSQLTSEGINIHYQDDIRLIPPDFTAKQNTMVVLTPAVPADHSELNWFRNNGFAILKRSELLGLISRDYHTVAVAGTHGKTTVSTMIAHILAGCSGGCNAFLGGISKNFNSNLVIDPQSRFMVTEADEFDRSFLQLHPAATVVTAMDADHLDIYGNETSMREAFNTFISQTDDNGILLMKHGLPIEKSSLPAKSYTYSLNSSGDFIATNIRLENQQYHFDLSGPGITIADISLEHPGLVNVENAVAASAMAWLLGIPADHIRHALHSFSGIQRRFDYHIKTDKVVYIDDYAHHPREIEATLQSVRELYPGQNITGVFQPHLYTRTRDFAEGFAKSLSLLDRLILLDIYPARELPIEGVTSEIIYRNVTITDKIMCTKSELIDILERQNIEVLITLGAGDIDKFIEPIRQMLQKKITA
ncbi:MAG: UDP-N-acetylmuramate--L-alanine ligase [Bacteroidales bacterium]|nr:UDP-N-acetylmuramate--L-alanine ligase [Bacteroidales bacterium]